MKLSSLLIAQLDMVALAAYNAGQDRAHAVANLIEARNVSGNVRAHCVKSARYHHHRYIGQIRHVRELMKIEGRPAPQVAP